MRNSTVQKGHQSAQKLHNKIKENNLGISKTSIGLAMDKYDKSERDLKDTEARAILKESSRINPTGTGL